MSRRERVLCAVVAGAIVVTVCVLTGSTAVTTVAGCVTVVATSLVTSWLLNHFLRKDGS